MRTPISFWSALFLLGTAGFSPISAHAAPALLQAPADAAQAGSSSITGTVRDSTGAVIVGATVTVVDSTGKQVKVTSDASGHYTVPGLAKGPANLTASAPGFNDVEQTGLDLSPNGSLSLDLPMSPTAVTTDVTVEAQRAIQVESENAEVSGTISEKQIINIGLNGRNFSSLITLSAGVSNQTGQDEAKVGVVGSAKFSVNGGRTEYNTFDVDGNDVLNTDIAASHGHSTLLVYPSLDAIQDMKVLTSNYGAQYGRSASGTVIVGLKAGADSYHGNAYEFVRNEMFNARNYFDAPGSAPLYRRQDFGFTIGGPIAPKHWHPKSDPKTFFFLSEEWRKERTPTEFNQGVPTDAERGYNILTQSFTQIADFSDVCPTGNGGTVFFKTAKYPDCPGEGYGGERGSYANNQFFIDPNAMVYLQNGLIPRANASTGCVSSIGSCYVSAISLPTDYREDLLRFDHTFNTNWKLYASGIHDHWRTTTAVPQWAANVNSFPSVLNSFQGPGASGIVHLTTVITPTLLNDFSIGATAQRVVLENLPGPGVTLDPTALRNTPNVMGSFFANCNGGEVATGNTCIGGKLPGLAFGGNNAEFGGAGFNVDTSYMPWFSTRVVGTVSDNVSKYLGKHTLALGIQFIAAERHEFGAANGANSGNLQGLLSFRNIGTLNTTGNAFADFAFNNSSPSFSALSGGENTYSYQQDSSQTTYKVSYWTIEPYLQDDYKVTPRLTVNVGLRVSLFNNWKPKGNKVFNWQASAFDSNLAANSNIAVNNLRGYLQNATTGMPLPIDTTNLNPVLTNGLVQCGINGVPDSCQSSQFVNLAPRVGFAWDPTGSSKTSIRGGYGIFFEHGTGSEANVGSLMGNPPQVLSMSEQYPANYQSIGSVGVANTSTYSSIESPLNMISIPSKTIWPRIQQWSFGVQRELNPETQVGIAYVGSTGTNLAVASQLNQLPPVPAAANPFGAKEPITQQLCLANQINPNNLEDPNAYFAFPNDGTTLYYGPNVANQPYNPTAFLALVAACDGTQGVNGHSTIAYGLNFLRPFRGLGKIQSITNAANSAYHSVQFTLHHVKGPLDVGLAYTYSHSIDTASDRFSSNFVDSFNLRANRASSDFDERQLFNLNYQYKLPLLRWEQFLTGEFHSKAGPPASDGNITVAVPTYNGPSRLVKDLFSNWSLSGLTIAQTGTPFSVINTASANGVSVLDNAGLALGESADSYPDLAKGFQGHCPRYGDAGTIGPIIGNSCRFVAPRGLTQGNAGRNSMNNPVRVNFDMSFLRDMKIRKYGSLQFRAEFFNIFNTTQFILYDPTRGNTSSNTISCYGDETDSYLAGAASCMGGNGFLHPIAAHRPRTVQFGLKFDY